MAELGATAGLLLAVVFGVAGWSKLRRPGATAVAFRALGLPAADALARALPLGELGLAGLLVVAPGAGGALALVALGAFSVVLGTALRRGTPVACGCFGAASDRVVDGTDLVRNLLLAAAAAVALGGVSGAWSLPAAVAASTAAVAALVAIALLRLRAATGTLLDTSVATRPGGAG